HHQRDADPAQRAAATAATEQAAQAIAEVAQATAAATALGRPGITAVAAGARTFGPLAVVLAGNVPGHACSSLGARRRVRCASVYRLRVPERPWMRTDGWQPVANGTRSSGFASLQGGVGLELRQERTQRGAVGLRGQAGGVGLRQVQLQPPAVLVLRFG